MLTLRPQFIKDSAGKNLVILSQNEFDEIIEKLEELEDIRLYDKSKKSKETSIPLEDAFKIIESRRKNK